MLLHEDYPHPIPTRAFQTCADVNPDQLSISESTGFDRGEFRHQGKCIEGRGKVTFKSGDFAGSTVEFKGRRPAGRAMPISKSAISTKSEGPCIA